MSVPPPPPPRGSVHPASSRLGALWATMGRGSRAALIVALLFIGLSALSALDGSDSTSSSSSTVARTCEIARDIAADVDIQTFDETRLRFKDLYDGYGQSAPADLAAALRALVAAMTSADPGAASGAIDQLDTACSSRGF